MEIDVYKKIRTDSKHQIDLSDPYKLRKLVKDLQDVLETGFLVDHNSLQRFSCYEKTRPNPFGYDLKKGEKLKNKKSFYRKNYLCHKLIRIRKELTFVKRNNKSYRELTLREKEIIQLLVNGCNNPEIAEKLYISRYTVEQHRKNINYKLKIKSFSSLLHYSYAFDLY